LDQHGRRGAVCVQFFIEPLKERIGVPVNASANSRGAIMVPSAIQLSMVRFETARSSAALSFVMGW
jgi:hypothetical protein